MIKKIIKGGNFDPQMIGELEFDQVPEEGSFNPVTSDAVVKAIDEAKEDMQEKIDEVTLDPSAVALGNVHLLNEVAEFPADGCILIDSETNGPGEMSKDTLLELTAQNALAGNVATAFDPTRDEDHKYLVGESVAYEGKTYTFKVDHYGAWNAADVEITSLFGKRNYTKDYGFGYNGGELSNPIGQSVSDYIPVSNGMTITLFFGLSPIYRSMRIYDENKDFVNYYGETENTSSRTITISNPTFKYIRFTFVTGCGAYAEVNDVRVWEETPDGAIDDLQSQIKNMSFEEFDLIIKLSRDNLIASCKLGYGNAANKNFQFAVVTDSHGDTLSVGNVVKLANDSDSIDMIFSLGDIVRNNFNDPVVIDEFFEEISKSTKPVLNVVGNHDVGFGYYVGNGCNHQQAYDTFIKPIVDKGWLDEGCYEDGKPYYYKDIASKKLRIIVVYEYDSDLAIDETKWSLVTYDSTKPMLSTSATYQQGDVVNVPNYTEHSFKANETIDMSGASIWNKNQFPSYKFQRGFRMVRKEQAEWLCATLISTPQDYTVVILTHNPFSSVANTEPNKLFCKNVSTSAAVSIQSVMETDIFAEIINAFNNGIELNINVKYKGDATYANTLTDGQGNSYAYNLSADFSAKNSGVNFLCYFGGHTHWDAIWRHPTYTDQIQVTSMEQGFQELTASDIQKNRSAAGGFGYNSILCASIDTSAKSVSLLKVGNQRTIDGRLRDFEILNLS